MDKGELKERPNCLFQPDSWVNFDDYVSKVIAVCPCYYEPFHSLVLDGQVRCGSRRYRQIVMRDLFNDAGRQLAGVPYMKYLEHVQEFIHPATQDDLLRIDRFQQKHPAEYNRWMERDTTCVEKVFVGFDCAPDKQKSMMASLRKLSRTLPSTFTYHELESFVRQGGVSLQSCCDEYASRYDNYVSFALTYHVGEMRGRKQLFRGIRDFDYRNQLEEQQLLNDPSCWFNFEHLFLFVARNVKEYLKDHPSQPLQSLFDQMKPAFMALVDSKQKSNPLAAAYFRWVPKRMFSRSEAWLLAADYLDTLSAQYPTAPLAALLRTQEWQKKYQFVYDACS